MRDRPTIHCLVSRPLPGGEFTRSARVPLQAVPTYLKAGYIAVGPDPQDVAALIEWQNEQDRLGNKPRWFR